MGDVGELIELFRKPSVAGELCGCGQPFETCEFWSEVGRLAFGSWSSETIARVGALQRQLSRQRYLPRLLVTGDDQSPFADTLREYGALYDTLYDAVATVASADVVVDASSGQGRHLRSSGSSRRA